MVREAGKLDAFIQALNRDVTNQFAASGKESGFVTAWQSFRARWGEWYGKYGSYWSLVLSLKTTRAAMADVEGFRGEVAEWERKFASLGGSSSQPHAPAAGFPDWLIAVAAAVGLAVVWMLARRGPAVVIQAAPPPPAPPPPLPPLLPAATAGAAR